MPIHGIGTGTGFPVASVPMTVPWIVVWCIINAEHITSKNFSVYPCENANQIWVASGSGAPGNITLVPIVARDKAGFGTAKSNLAAAQ